MKGYIAYFALVFLSISIAACEDEEQTTPKDQYYGSLTATIDSLNEFKINVSKSQIDTSVYNGTKLITIEAIDDGSNTLLIYIPSRDTGMFQLAQGVESTIRYTTKQGVVYRGKSGKIHVTKSDFLNKKLSGTFTAKLIQTGSTDTIYIHNGVFVELPLPFKK